MHAKWSFPALGVALLSLAILAAPTPRAALAAGMPGVGDKPPAFEKTDLDGKPLSLKQYLGKVVLVDFWATWCGPCRAELPNVIKVYEEYHAQGFEILGISLDQDKGALTKYIAAQKMTWRQYFDGKGWENEISTQWGITGIPAAFLIDAEGVIRYANLRGEAPLAAAVKDLLAKVPADEMSKSVAEATELVAAKEYKKAAGLLRAAAASTSPSAARAKELLGELDKSVGEPRLAEAKKLAEEKKYAEAMEALRALAADLEGCPSAAAAKAEMVRLAGLPEVKELQAKEKAGERAGEMLARAKEREAQKAVAGAYGLDETLAKEFGDTQAGKDAAARLAEMAKDPALMAGVEAERAKAECEGWLRQAENFAKNKMSDKARELLKKVMEKYPDTEYAKRAKEKLSALK
ncbi:MAG: redoxin domain-containing protein [Planctomycetes bacterium]|nr:redoxin domain-containing protein [Planctomycetota bacterium]